MDMRFEARDLKPYIQPVKMADLVVGRLYFTPSARVVTS